MTDEEASRAKDVYAERVTRMMLAAVRNRVPMTEENIRTICEHAAMADHDLISIHCAGCGYVYPLGQSVRIPAHHPACPIARSNS